MEISLDILKNLKTITELKIYTYLVENNGEAKLLDLQNNLGISRTNLNRNISQMEKRNIISTYKNEKGSRFITLTKYESQNMTSQDSTSQNIISQNVTVTKCDSQNMNDEKTPETKGFYEFRACASSEFSPPKEPKQQKNEDLLYLYTIDINKFNIYNIYNKDLYKEILINNKDLYNINLRLYYKQINSLTEVNPNIYLNNKGYNKIAVALVKYLHKIVEPKSKNWFPQQLGFAKQLMEKYRPDQIVAGIDYYTYIEPFRKRGITSLLLLKNEKKMAKALNYFRSLYKEDFIVKDLTPQKEEREILTEDDIINQLLENYPLPVNGDKNG